MSPVEEQAIACMACGATDTVRSDDARATFWPAWPPGPLTKCPRCGSTAWATHPRPVTETVRMLARCGWCRQLINESSDHAVTCTSPPWTPDGPTQPERHLKFWRENEPEPPW